MKLAPEHRRMEERGTHASGKGDVRNMSLDARKDVGREERVMWMLGLRSQILERIRVGRVSLTIQG